MKNAGTEKESNILAKGCVPESVMDIVFSPDEAEAWEVIALNDLTILSSWSP